MKKLLLIFFILITLSFSGCADKITLDNIDSFETDFRYSKVSGGKIKKCDEDMVIKDAKDFANKFMATLYNKDYTDDKSSEYVKVIYSKNYLDKHEEELDKYIKFTDDLYKKYELTTELVNTDIKQVIKKNDDAYVVCVARVKLTNCKNPEVAKILGFTEGVNSSALIKYGLKVQYNKREFRVYDYEIIEEDGYLLAFDKYEERLNNIALTDEEKAERFAYIISEVQNNIVYTEFEGNEHYPYLTERYIVELNRFRDDAKNNKDAYSGYELSTSLEDCKITNTIKTSTGYTVQVEITVKVLNCISDEVATQLGFTNGIGSTRKMRYSYHLVMEGGEFKLDRSEFLG
ncbi:MAG: hypothetical protein IKZ35_00510 [Clostridia bacterium]|nr:hypothetical protein [Clostridia bacterium]